MHTMGNEAQYVIQPGISEPMKHMRGVIMANQKYMIVIEGAVVTAAATTKGPE